MDSTPNHKHEHIVFGMISVVAIVAIFAVMFATTNNNTNLSGQAMKLSDGSGSEQLNVQNPSIGAISNFNTFPIDTKYFELNGYQVCKKLGYTTCVSIFVDMPMIYYESKDGQCLNQQASDNTWSTRLFPCSTIIKAPVMGECTTNSDPTYREPMYGDRKSLGTIYLDVICAR